MTRKDGRTPNEARKLIFTPNYTMHAEGSILVETGNTKVLCTASVENKVPSFLKGKGKGWISAEYGMLPRSTNTRIQRERGKVGGRTLEIQRLIGRSLRSVVDLNALGERTVWLDCDVLQADGGTRTASITGAYVALVYALKKLVGNGDISKLPLTNQIAAVSLGLKDGVVLLDLNYEEDSTADVDLNVVMTCNKQIVEIQGTAEGSTFSRSQLSQMMDIAEEGLENYFKKQVDVLGGELIF